MIDVPAKIESVAFGSDIAINTDYEYTLFLADVNDFQPAITDSNHPAGIANPNKFLVFAVDEADLPNYVPQSIATPEHD